MSREITQEEIDAKIEEANALCPVDKADALQNDIERKSGNLVMLGRFLDNFIGTMENRELDKYNPEPSPVVSVASPTGERKPASTNPWSKAGWNTTEQGRLVKRLGEAKAIAIAKAAGCVLGSTKPNAAFN